MRFLVIGLLFLWTTPAIAAPGDVIGPSISDELEAAGLMGLPFSWRPSDGAMRTSDPRLTDAQRETIAAVFAAHNPTKLSAAQSEAQKKKQVMTNLINHCTMIEADALLPANVKTLCTLLKSALP